MEEKKYKMNPKVKEIIEWLYCVLIALVLALIVRYFVGTPTIVQQVSMYPTLEEGQRLILNRWSRTVKEVPERGEIITFEAPSDIGIPFSLKEDDKIANYDKEPKNVFTKFIHYVLEIGKKSYIKRVIALPGERVEIREEKVYINGVLLDEPYLPDRCYNKCRRCIL